MNYFPYIVLRGNLYKTVTFDWVDEYKNNMKFNVRIVHK